MPHSECGRPVVWGAALAFVFLSFSTVVGAQAPLEFEAASVKPNRSGETRTYHSGLTTHFLTGQIISFRPHIAITNLEVINLIRLAYGVTYAQQYALVGGLPDVLTSRFDIAATIPDGATNAQVAGMLRTLLADRFKLRIHQETREMPAYALTVARPGRLGPAMVPSQTICIDFLAARATDTSLVEPRARNGDPLCLHSDSVTPVVLSSSTPIDGVVLRVQGFVDRPLVDATGLAGNFAWQLTFSLGDSPNATAPSLRDALPEQLGLKLEPRTASVGVWVIDAVQLPTPD